MLGKTYPEVLVMGAGPVGLCAALVLAKRGVRVSIVDKEWRSGAHSYALALHSDTLNLLQELGVRDRVVSQGLAVRTIGLFDGQGRRGELRIAAPDSSDTVVVMRQDVLERVLEEALAEADVPVLWNHSVSRLVSRPDCAVATVDKLIKESVGYAVARTEWMVAKTAEVEVPFVIAADGHQSLARRRWGSNSRRSPSRSTMPFSSFNRISVSATSCVSCSASGRLTSCGRCRVSIAAGASSYWTMRLRRRRGRRTAFPWTLAAHAIRAWTKNVCND